MLSLLYFLSYYYVGKLNIDNYALFHFDLKFLMRESELLFGDTVEILVPRNLMISSSRGGKKEEEGRS